MCYIRTINNDLTGDLPPLIACPGVSLPALPDVVVDCVLAEQSVAIRAMDSLRHDRFLLQSLEVGVVT